MQLLEVDRKEGDGRLGLQVIVAIGAEAPLESVLPDVKGALREWAQSRGDAAKWVLISFVGPGAWRDATRRIVDETLRADSLLAPIVSRLDLRIMYQADDQGMFSDAAVAGGAGSAFAPKLLLVVGIIGIVGAWVFIIRMMVRETPPGGGAISGDALIGGVMIALGVLCLVIWHFVRPRE